MKMEGFASASEKVIIQNWISYKNNQPLLYQVFLVSPRMTSWVMDGKLASCLARHHTSKRNTALSQKTAFRNFVLLK